MFIQPPRHRYCPQTIIFAFIMFTQSPRTYELLKEYMVLPHKNHLRRLSAAMHISPDTEINTINYLGNISKHLQPHQKIVLLLIDEIYLKSKIEYKSHKITGFASNNDSLASTVQSFMIKSPFSHFREIVKLIPVSSSNGSELYDMVKIVINFVQSNGFQIIAIITDNNRINQTMFKMFSNTHMFQNPHPSYSSDQIFLMYDTVHAFKNIRNNWINLTTLNHTFTYSDWETSELKYASFSHLRDLYTCESNMLIKKAYKLNYKTVYPSNLDRLNVSLADNIFHESTISALDPTNYAQKSTGDFMQIIKNWWNIVNTKSPNAGVRTRSDFKMPFRSLDDERLIFLIRFIEWLKTWNVESNCGRLSNDTFKAIVQSTTVIMLSSQYLHWIVWLNDCRYRTFCQACFKQMI